MRRFILLALPLLALLASCGDVPVEDIEMYPASSSLFVGESVDVSIHCYPEDADNIGELEVYSSNESVITYENGRVTGVGDGQAAITATCGSVLAQSKFRVYAYSLYKAAEKYGIDYASGYIYMMAQATPQELEIILVHQDGNGKTQNFKVWLTVAQLGQDLDFTQPLEGPFVGVYANNNEDGYLVYASSSGTPMIVTADWSWVDGITLKKGILRVDQITAHKYRVHADFELSSGYRFGTDWEGTSNMKIE